MPNWLKKAVERHRPVARRSFGRNVGLFNKLDDEINEIRIARLLSTANVVHLSILVRVACMGFCSVVVRAQENCESLPARIRRE